jgi:hypothetical protein
MPKVIIRIKNGIAESVEDIPTDMSIEVRNYPSLVCAIDQYSYRENEHRAGDSNLNVTTSRLS